MKSKFNRVVHDAFINAHNVFKSILFICNHNMTRCENESDLITGCSFISDIFYLTDSSPLRSSFPLWQLLAYLHVTSCYQVESWSATDNYRKRRQIPKLHYAWTETWPQWFAKLSNKLSSKQRKHIPAYIMWEQILMVLWLSTRFEINGSYIFIIFGWLVYVSDQWQKS